MEWFFIFKSRVQSTLFLLFLLTPELFSQELTHVHISEIMASNTSGITDIEGEFSDWIEIHNPTGSVINLEGWYLTDDPDNLIKWVFPAISIDAHGFLLVFASGKDRRGPELHTNFKLSSGGEWILLVRPDGQTLMPPFTTSFPVQYSDISFGYYNGSLGYLNQPTPDAPNVAGDYMSPPHFSHAHGHYSTPFILTLSTINASDSIIYTIDASDPTGGSAIFYDQPIQVDSTLILRAATKRFGTFSEIMTSTYLFPSVVKNQPAFPAGYPETWGPFSTIAGDAPADYGMDPEICNSAAYVDLLVPALTSIPTLSLVADKNAFFSLEDDPVKGGIYAHTNPPTGGLGEDWERAVSAEYFDPESADGFQVNCGVRIHGGHSRVPEKNPKHSFRLLFRETYGPGKLNFDFFGDSATTTFNSIVLRAGFNQTWTHWDAGQRNKAQYIQDSWAKDMFRLMGHQSARNKFVHLYINGLYWGLYNISERLDAEYMQTYFGGNEEDYDVIKDYAEVADGNIDAWNKMMEAVKNGLTSKADFYRIQGKDENGNPDPSIPAYLDLDNFIDYMILNFYGGNLDWDHHNWVAARNRNEPGSGFRFFPWDTERIFLGKSDKTVEENNENRPSFIYTELRKNGLFRKMFADRANELLSPGGWLGPEKAMATYQNRADEVALAVNAESARWGDYRRDVHPYSSTPYLLYTKDHWLTENQRLLKDYFPERSAIVLNQLKSIGLAGDIITGIEESIISSTTTYPNPFTESVRIAVPVRYSGAVEINIMSTDGRTVFRQVKPGIPGAMAEFVWKPVIPVAGLYLYKIEMQGHSSTGKVIYQP